MAQRDKRIKKVFSDSPLTFTEARSILIDLGFVEHSKGSHHIFRHPDCQASLSIKKRTRLLEYQKMAIREALEHLGYG